MSDTEISRYHSKDIMEFVTVGLEFCKRLECAEASERKDFIGAMLKILPLLYIKAQIALDFRNEEDCYIEHIVSETDYDAIRCGVAAVMGEYDDFLEVFVEDMKYSDEPIHCTVSECMADLYQEIADFLYVFKQDFEESTAAALGEISESFKTRWGQILVNVLRPLHETRYSVSDEESGECDD